MASSRVLKATMGNGELWQTKDALPMPSRLGISWPAGWNARTGCRHPHTGQGPDNTVAVYHFSDLDPVRTVAVYQQIADQGRVESQAVDLA